MKVAIMKKSLFKELIISSLFDGSTNKHLSRGGEISLCGGIIDRIIKHPAYIDSRTAIGKPSPFDKEIETSACSICSIAISLKTRPLKIIFTESGRYFEWVQPHTHHTCAKEGVNVYSFSLKPEEHQPSGTCNFSRIDVAELKTTYKNLSSTDNIYAVNYNVLRIMSGMGGLAYSN